MGLECNGPQEGFVVGADKSQATPRRFRLHWLSLALTGMYASILVLLNAVPRNEQDSFSFICAYGWPFKPAVVWLTEYMNDPKRIQWAADVINVGEFHIALRYVALNLLVLVAGAGLLVVSAEFAIRKVQTRIDADSSLGWFIRPSVSLRTLVILTLLGGALLYPYVSVIQESLQYQGHLNFSTWEVPVLAFAPVAILLMLAWLLERGRC